MNFDFSDDQKHLRSEARRFLEAQGVAARSRAVADDPARLFDRELWAAVSAQGWLGASIPEAYGGLGLGRLELCVIAEELGRVAAPIPFASTAYLLTEALLLAGSPDQQARVLPAIATGEAIGAMAAPEGPGVVRPETLKASVAEGRLSGVKAPVVDGGSATHAVVLANEGGRAGLFLVDLGSGGVVRERLETIDPTREVARLTFDGASAERLGGAGEGFELLQRIYDRAAVMLSFEQCGGADRCLEMARDYALARYAFGRQIGAFQAIKHRLADMYVKNELARSNAYYAAWALNTDAPELPVAAAAARIAASEACWFAAKENIHVHGGIGFTWEMDCHLYYRRAQHLSLAVGAPRTWKERLVSQLERRNAA